MSKLQPCPHCGAFMKVGTNCIFCETPILYDESKPQIDTRLPSNRSLIKAEFEDKVSIFGGCEDFEGRLVTMSGSGGILNRNGDLLVPGKCRYKKIVGAISESFNGVECLFQYDSESYTYALLRDGRIIDLGYSVFSDIQFDIEELFSGLSGNTICVIDKEAAHSDYDSETDITFHWPERVSSLYAINIESRQSYIWKKWDNDEELNLMLSEDNTHFILYSRYSSSQRYISKTDSFGVKHKIAGKYSWIDFDTLSKHTSTLQKKVSNNHKTQSSDGTTPKAVIKERGVTSAKGKKSRNDEAEKKQWRIVILIPVLFIVLSLFIGGVLLFYKPSFDNPPAMVELGLSVKWASCNLGASSPEEYGDYFAWGETDTKEDFSENTSIKTLFLSTDGNTTKLTERSDVAYQLSSGDLRMPTKEDFEELRNNCYWKSTRRNGVRGVKVIGPNGNSIFFPATGRKEGTSVVLASECGYYWSSSASIDPTTDYDNATMLFFDSRTSSVKIDEAGARWLGRTIRPVYEKKEVFEKSETTSAEKQSFQSGYDFLIDLFTSKRDSLISESSINSVDSFELFHYYLTEKCSEFFMNEDEDPGFSIWQLYGQSFADEWGTLDSIEEDYSKKDWFVARFIYSESVEMTPLVHIKLKSTAGEWKIDECYLTEDKDESSGTADRSEFAPLF